MKYERVVMNMLYAYQADLKSHFKSARYVAENIRGSIFVVLCLIHIFRMGASF